MTKARKDRWIHAYLRNEQVVRMAHGGGFRLTGGFGYRRSGPDPEPFIVTWHTNFDLVYVLPGHREYLDSENRRYKLNPGVFFQRLPEIHSTQFFSPDYGEAYLSISQDALRFLQAFQSNVLKAPRVVDFGLLREIPLRYEQLLRDLRDTPEPHLAGVVLRILEFYIEILGGSSSPQMKLIEKACLLMTAEPSSRTRLQSVARTIGLGYSNFRRLFHHIMGMSPGDYRIQKRIELACELLSAGSSQKQVAFQLGYPDVQGFSRQFRRFIGIPPGAFLEKTRHKRMYHQTKRP